MRLCLTAVKDGAAAVASFLPSIERSCFSPMLGTWGSRFSVTTKFTFMNFNIRVSGRVVLEFPIVADGGPLSDEFRHGGATSANRAGRTDGDSSSALTDQDTRMIIRRLIGMSCSVGGSHTLVWNRQKSPGDAFDFLFAGSMSLV
jgi:hypothetical protein